MLLVVYTVDSEILYAAMCFMVYRNIYGMFTKVMATTFFKLNCSDIQTISTQFLLGINMFIYIK